MSIEQGGDEFGRSAIRLKRELKLYGLVGQSVGRPVFWREVNSLVIILVGWLVGRSVSRGNSESMMREMR